MDRNNCREHGAALLLAFLAILVLVVVVGQIAVTSAVERSIANYSLRDLEYEYAARGGLELAKAMLLKDLKDEQAQSEAEGGPETEPDGLQSIQAGQAQDESPTDSMQDEWADSEKSAEEFGDGISMKIVIIDEDRKFNLLMLAVRDAEFRAATHERFVRLLDTFREDSKHDLTNGEATDLTDRFTDWLMGKRQRDFPTPLLSSSIQDDEPSSAVFGRDRFAEEEQAPIVYPLGLDELVTVDGMSDSLLHGFIEDGRYIPGLEDVVTIFSNLRFDEEAMEEEEEDGSVFGRPSRGSGGFGEDDDGDGEQSAVDGGLDPNLSGNAEDQATETSQGRLNINTTPMRVLRCLADPYNVPYSVLEKIDEFRREMFTDEYRDEHMDDDDEPGFSSRGSVFGNSGDRGAGQDGESSLADEEEDYIFKNPGEVFDRVEQYYGMDFGLSDEIKQEFTDFLTIKSSVFTVILELRSNKGQGGSVFESRGRQAPPDRLYRAVVWRRTGSDGKLQCITLVPLHPWAGVVPPDTEEYREEFPFGF